MVAKSIKEMFDISGRAAIITGGAGLLGTQYARVLLAAGAKVALVDIHAGNVKAAADKLGKETHGEAMGIKADITKKDDVRRMADTVLKRWGRIDILINNAALNPKVESIGSKSKHYTFENYPVELWRRSFDVDLTGAFLCSQVVGKVMLKQKKGVIVNIGSTYGLVAPDQSLYAKVKEVRQKFFKPASYSVTKAGIIQFTRYLAAYWGGGNIRVNTLIPGGVYNNQDEEFVRKYSKRTPMGRMADKNELSGALLFLVSDASSYMTGANLVIDGGFTCW